MQEQFAATTSLLAVLDQRLQSIEKTRRSRKERELSNVGERLFFSCPFFYFFQIFPSLLPEVKECLVELVDTVADELNRIDFIPKQKFNFSSEQARSTETEAAATPQVHAEVVRDMDDDEFPVSSEMRNSFCILFL